MKIITLSALFAVSVSAANVTPVPPVFVPVGVYYQNGKLANVKAFPEHVYDNLAECSKAVQEIMFKAQASGNVMRMAGGGTALVKAAQKVAENFVKIKENIA